jgi:uncharacterized membrane protein (DUF485 family)
MDRMDLHSEEYLQTVMGRQLRLSIGIASIFVTIIVAIPLLNLFAPEIMNTPFMGFTVTWFILCFAIFPVLILLAWLFVRRSNAFEDGAVAMVNPDSLPTANDPDPDPNTVF